MDDAKKQRDGFVLSIAIAQMSLTAGVWGLAGWAWAAIVFGGVTLFAAFALGVLTMLRKE